MAVAPLSDLAHRQRGRAMRRWELLRPVVEDGVPLAAAARHGRL